jgi:hypothetical protein
MRYIIPCLALHVSACWPSSGAVAVRRLLYYLFASFKRNKKWKGSASISGERAPSTHWKGGWVGPRTSLDDVEKRKFLTLPGLELRPLQCPACSKSLYQLQFQWFHKSLSFRPVLSQFSPVQTVTFYLSNVFPLLTCVKNICFVMCVHLQVEKHMKEQAAAEAAMSVAGAQTSPQ